MKGKLKEKVTLRTSSSEISIQYECRNGIQNWVSFSFIFIFPQFWPTDVDLNLVFISLSNSIFLNKYAPTLNHHGL